MIAVLQTVGSIAAISVVLTVIISLAERWLNNYGECKIDINGGKRTLTVQGGQTLLSALADQKIFIPSACGGKATCGLCKVKVLSGAGPLLPTEEPYLDEEERKQHVRLSCQIKVKQDLSIEVPAALFNIREFIGTIERIDELTHDIKGLRIKLPEGQTIDFKAGQFMQLYTKPYGKIKETVFRAYSISSNPSDNGYIELIIRLVPDGIATGYVHGPLKVGDELRLSGPYGDFYLHGEKKDLIMIAGGSGLAPIRSLVLDITEKGLDYNMTFYFGASTVRDVYYLEEFREIEKKYPNFRFVPAISQPVDGDGWTGETGRITEVVGRHVADGTESEAYLCGSPGMLDACIAVLHTKNVSDDRIFYDKF